MILLVYSIFLSLSIVFVFCTVVLMDLLVYCTLINKPLLYSKFGQIRPATEELAALERLKKSP